MVLGILAGSVLGFAAASAVGRPGPSSAAKPVKSTVNVTAGIPSELAFTLSKTSAGVGTVTFKVKNSGTVAHSFKVCMAAAKTSATNTCIGKATKLIDPGKTAVLVVTFTKAGTYEYVCTVAGHAAGGMKGLVGIGVKVAGGTTTGNTTTTGKTTLTGPTTTTSGPKETLGGDPVNGANVFRAAACGSCHVLRASGAVGQVGPSLDDAKPGQDLVIQRVANGLNLMPSFRSELTDQQIKDVAAYVYQSTHCRSRPDREAALPGSGVSDCD
jgi:mono/diheme cytochrome c family protein/uncharacterized cupredoxin-like copper-binding protein